MSFGLDALLKRIESDYSVQLVNRFVSLVREVPNKEKQKDYLFRLVYVVAEFHPRDALLIIQELHDQYGDDLSVIDATIFCFEKLGRHSKVEVLKIEREKLASQHKSSFSPTFGEYLSEEAKIRADDKASSHQERTHPPSHSSTPTSSVQPPIRLEESDAEREGIFYDESPSKPVMAEDFCKEIAFAIAKLNQQPESFLAAGQQSDAKPESEQEGDKAAIPASFFAALRHQVGLSGTDASQHAVIGSRNFVIEELLKVLYRAGVEAEALFDAVLTKDRLYQPAIAALYVDFLIQVGRYEAAVRLCHYYLEGDKTEASNQLDELVVSVVKRLLQKKVLSGIDAVHGEDLTFSQAKHILQTAHLPLNKVNILVWDHSLN